MKAFLKQYYFAVIVLVYILTEFILHEFYFFQLKRSLLRMACSLVLLAISFGVKFIFKRYRIIFHGVNIFFGMLLFSFLVFCLKVSLIQQFAAIQMSAKVKAGVIVFGVGGSEPLKIRNGVNYIRLNSLGCFITSSPKEKMNHPYIFEMKNDSFIFAFKYNSIYTDTGKLYSKDSSVYYNYYSFYTIPYTVMHDSLPKLKMQAFVRDSMLTYLRRKILKRKHS